MSRGLVLAPAENQTCPTVFRPWALAASNLKQKVNKSDEQGDVLGVYGNLRDCSAWDSFPGVVLGNTL